MNDNKITSPAVICWDKKKTVVKHFKKGVKKLKATICSIKLIQIFNIEEK